MSYFGLSTFQSEWVCVSVCGCVCLRESTSVYCVRTSFVALGILFDVRRSMFLCYSLCLCYILYNIRIPFDYISDLVIIWLEKLPHMRYGHCVIVNDVHLQSGWCLLVIVQCGNQPAWKASRNISGCQRCHSGIRWPREISIFHNTRDELNT